VAEALAQLTKELMDARRTGDDALLVVHGYGASGEGGAIKAAVRTELPRLERVFNVKAYGQADKDRVPERIRLVRRDLSAGATLLVFRRAAGDRESTQSFRPNFRELRKRVKVRRATRSI
jgi:polyphosphate kinase 2 (PPK2 family)